MLWVLVVVKTLNLEISRCHLADSDNWRIVLKCVPHAQHDYFSSFSQSDHFFLELLLLLPSSLLKLPIENGTIRLCKTAKWFQMSIQADKNGATWSKPRSISVNLHPFLFSPLFFLKGANSKLFEREPIQNKTKQKLKDTGRVGLLKNERGFLLPCSWSHEWFAGIYRALFLMVSTYTRHRSTTTVNDGACE